MRFYEAPIGWVNLLADRVRHHFEVFRLGRLYAADAAEDLLNIREYLNRLYHEGDADVVRAHLQDLMWSAEAAHINSWQTATYRAFSISDWFCDGGFAVVG